MNWYIAIAICIFNVLFLLGGFILMHRSFSDRNRKVDAHFRARERDTSLKAWKKGAETHNREVKRLQDRVTLLEERLRKAGLSTW
jgi:hypothetical protein